MGLENQFKGLNIYAQFYFFHLHLSSILGFFFFLGLIYFYLIIIVWFRKTNTRQTIKWCLKL